ncbi:anti-sigma-28 factor FlgM [Erwinia sp. OLTSP20]|uniref:flagellar biosynthesis anti-sigma factor FlgM n=1 Tax=unclassified Erwinia TaxID=2622719 RepID=UPI000C19CE37|nr:MULTISPECIES: flagellar biosynthesis anti-sigma factor FlgM [unclassified Erwinia]PIJ51917.1 anti-sigma-28 factor FlgM [Erwinia sp. OAMSP11]PIJ74792.1 anti-sigma-28 factor FlgM [Erwinia sp. OLSSP12]PIJ85178.1 anti-sigma-28 factor FlgM [Erwinia sp. OLCASP19]PIJ87179.1 anti-sigma-28 factor FlgM [Erwinia sp. OLMTSP26]PIJ88323.1 anti-sigma-28 factor FlgM [Erwinia sp. OLMDSP33]
MSIDRTQPLKPAATVQPRENHDAPLSKARAPENKTSQPGTQVVLSDAKSQLTKASSQDIDAVRVEQLKTAIRNGELKMDAGKIADALIQEAKSSLQDN